jgi:hypothetical protein
MSHSWDQEVTLIVHSREVSGRVESYYNVLANAADAA